MGPGVVQDAVAAVGVDVQGEVDGAERQPGHPRDPREFQRVHHSERGFDQRYQGKVLWHVRRAAWRSAPASSAFGTTRPSRPDPGVRSAESSTVMSAS